MQETGVRSLGWEDPLEKGMATQPSILAWRISWTEQPGGLQSMGSQSVRHNWVTTTFTFHFLFLFFYYFNEHFNVMYFFTETSSPFFFFFICFKRICNCCGSIFMIAALKSLLGSPNIRFTLVLVSVDWLFSIKLWFPGFYYDGWFFYCILVIWAITLRDSESYWNVRFRTQSPWVSLAHNFWPIS